VTLERLRGEVVSVNLDADGSRACVRLDDGSEIDADRVVLAIGNASPAPS
jgi:glycine/D-amino acid oxidase-like deaminating enzyme